VHLDIHFTALNAFNYLYLMKIQKNMISIFHLRYTYVSITSIILYNIIYIIYLIWRSNWILFIFLIKVILKSVLLTKHNNFYRTNYHILTIVLLLIWKFFFRIKIYAVYVHLLGVQKSSELFFVKFNLLNLSHRM